jgi:Tfp pilus assembly protein PilF
MLALLSGGAEEAPAPVTPTPGARDLTREARSLVADPFGYVHAGAARPATAELALALLERALEESPDYGLALQLYGILNELRERPALADAAFRQAVHAAPEGAWSLNNVALFYWRQGLLRHSYYVLMLALERYRDPRTARLLAHLHRAPGGADLVPAAEACTLIEWVLRTYPEPSHEKTVADRDYHRELCAQLARTRA